MRKTSKLVLLFDEGLGVQRRVWQALKKGDVAADNALLIYLAHHQRRDALRREQMYVSSLWRRLRGG